MWQDMAEDGSIIEDMKEVWNLDLVILMLLDEVKVIAGKWPQ